MKNQKCPHLHCDGYDVKCGVTGYVLGDIMGYDNHVCSDCPLTSLKGGFVYSETDSTQLKTTQEHLVASEIYPRIIHPNVKGDIKMDIQRNTMHFKELCFTVIKREGIKELLDYLENNTDFFDAPCSTRYHLSVEGGLVQHSLNVYRKFNTLCGVFQPDFKAESRAICALFHDLCKYHCYDPCKRSRKTGRTLPNGKPEWEDYMGYEFSEEFPYGHGEKSVYLLQKFIKLTDDEAMAIRWHMGYSDATFKGGMQTVSNAMKLYPVIALLHSADMIAATEEE